METDGREDGKEKQNDDAFGSAFKLDHFLDAGRRLMRDKERHDQGRHQIVG
ncbi:Uncharacterised protein [Vibrio cholerae]|nr:Uncharacterised protein [Vibrio cholerae]CSB53570.1 Uncharacterised protein [Vibrio cholerae]CSC47075.1 Uncharacterised protein [Vibrio cholerae]CSD21042.1 Uncharacterised protein [Vibrio cholerae]CSI18985.1 Uncharacterised protein [Vibrio cholerae]